MNLSPRFAQRIRPFVRHELDAAAERESRGEFDSAFAHLERAHVLAQTSTVEHVRVHWAMFRWALRHDVAREAVGQAWRIAGALLKTWLWVPVGNPGGAKVSGFRPMPVPPDLQRCIDVARRASLKSASQALAFLRARPADTPGGRTSPTRETARSPCLPAIPWPPWPPSRSRSRPPCSSPPAPRRRSTST
jgi:hypothetical protein